MSISNDNLEHLIREEIAEHEELSHEHRLLAIGFVGGVLAYLSARYAERRKKRILAGEIYPNTTMGRLPDGRG